MAHSVVLERMGYFAFGTFGQIELDGALIFTIERPWADNKVGVSCIPDGEYEMRRGRYNKGGYPAFEIEDVPNRSLIKIHRANHVHEVDGCIAVGMDLKPTRAGVPSESPMQLVYSKRAHDHLMRVLDQDRYQLSIRSGLGAV